MFLDIDKKGYMITGGYAVRKTLSELGARWNNQKHAWVLPSTLRPDLIDVLPGLEMSKEAERRLSSARARDALLWRLQSAEAADVAHGRGLDPYQRVGVKFLATARRAVLADAPGLGKTAQVIRASEEVGAKKVLVITRKSLIYTWKQQIAQWRTSDDQEYEVTNYEQVAKHAQKYLARSPDTLVADECSLIKNRKTTRAQAIYALAKTIPTVWLVTGTPVLNRPDELWSLLHAVDPERFRSYWRFVEAYCELEFNPWSGGKRVVGVLPGAKTRLAEELGNILLRRTADAVALPPITQETVYVELEGEQKELYEQMLKKFFVLLEEEKFLAAPTVLAQLTRLRQITCTPALIGGPDKSAKTEAVIDLVDSFAEDHKVLVFSAFAGYVDNLTKKLTKYGAVKITGSQSAPARNEAVHRLNNDPTCRALVGTLGAMGEGLNLQSASVVVFADKQWVPAAMEQAVARAHRRGQDRRVHVVSVVAPGTVDDHIEGVLRAKQAVIRDVDIITRMLSDWKLKMTKK